MEDEDFDFPPDGRSHSPTVEVMMPMLPHEGLPLGALAHTPVEQLPPTVPPGGERRSLGQAIRAALVMGPRSHFSSSSPLASEGRAPSLGSSQPQTSTSAPEAEVGTQAAAASHSPPQRFLAAASWQETTPRSRLGWTEGEVRGFYQALAQYGTDFGAIAVLYPSRTRADIKRLYHRELRRRQEDVRRALEAKEPIDLDVFNERLATQRQQETQQRKNTLRPEEEALLSQMEVDLGTRDAGATDPPITAPTAESRPSKRARAGTDVDGASSRSHKTHAAEALVGGDDDHLLMDDFDFD